MKNLLILCADPSIKVTVETLLAKRKKSLNISDISYELKVHDDRDTGVLNEGLELTRKYRNQFHKFILIFDYDGCGSSESPEEIRERLLNQGRSLGFSEDNLELIIINPELEIWVWKNIIHLAKMVGWTESQLRDWLKSNYGIENKKPEKPQAVYRKLLWHRQKPKSADNFRYLAEKISLRNCQEQGFKLFSETLRKWFPK